MLGVLIVPEKTARVRIQPSGYEDEFGTVGNNAIFVSSSIRAENMIQLSGNSNINMPSTIIELLDSDDQVLETCGLELIPFDAGTHSVSNLTVGNCDFGNGNQVLHMTVGEVRPITLPEKHSEAVPSLGIDLTNKGPGRIVLYGMSAGFGMFSWSAFDQSLGGICPVTVSRTFGK